MLALLALLTGCNHDNDLFMRFTTDIDENVDVTLTQDEGIEKNFTLSGADDAYSEWVSPGDLYVYAKTFSDDGEVTVGNMYCDAFKKGDGSRNGDIFITKNEDSTGLLIRGEYSYGPCYGYSNEDTGS